MAFPSPEDRRLQRAVADLREKLDNFDQWVVKFTPDRDRSGKPLPKELSYQLLELRRRTRNLTIAASVPVAVAVYGASQCGKSLLMGRLTEVRNPDESTLGLCATDPLAEQITFVRDLNPMKAGEATAVVTRFTLGERAKDSIDPRFHEKYPVRARLCTSADLIKALGRGFFTECQGQEDWTETTLRALLKRIGSMFGGGSVNSEWRADILEAYRYLKDDMRHHRMKIDPVVLSQMLLGVPLTQEGYIELTCTIFWENWGPISQLYKDLWRHRNEKYTCVEHVLMSWHVVHFILDSGRDATYPSDALSGTPKGLVEWSRVRVRTEGTQRIVAYGGEGQEEDLALLQGIISELQIPLRSDRLNPDGARLFEQADCLDIPGARTPAGASDMSLKDMNEKEAESKGSAILHVLKRGRVGLMFDKYAEERQASALLYLQSAGPLEARGEIAPQINRWGRC